MPLEDGNSLEEMAKIAESESSLGGDDTAGGDDVTNTDDTDVTDVTNDSDGDDTDDDAGDDSSDDSSPLTKRGLMQWFEQQYGLDMSKYASDADGLHGIANAMRLIGQRDEDAQWASKLKPYKDQIEALVSGKKDTTPVDDEPEYNEGWELLIQKGSASPDIVEKYNKHVAWERDKLRQLIKSPESVLGDLLEKKLGGRVNDIEERAKQINDALAQRDRDAAINSWVGQHASDIYVDGAVGGDLTPLGKRAAAIYNDQFIQGLAGQLSENPQLALSELALRLAKAEAPKPNKTKAPGKGAVRKPNIAAGGGDKTAADTAIEKIDAGASLADVLYELSQSAS